MTDRKPYVSESGLRKLIQVEAHDLRAMVFVHQQLPYLILEGVLDEAAQKGMAKQVLDRSRAIDESLWRLRFASGLAKDVTHFPGSHLGVFMGYLTDRGVSAEFQNDAENNDPSAAALLVTIAMDIVDGFARTELPRLTKVRLGNSELPHLGSIEFSSDPSTGTFANKDLVAQLAKWPNRSKTSGLGTRGQIFSEALGWTAIEWKIKSSDVAEITLRSAA